MDSYAFYILYNEKSTGKHLHWLKIKFYGNPHLHFQAFKLNIGLDLAISDSFQSSQIREIFIF